MIRIFTDSGSNIPPELLSKYHIGVVELPYFMDGVPVTTPMTEFDGEAFYGRMRHGAEVRTSLANVGAFTEAFLPVLEAGDDLIYVGMSGGISGTFQASRIAAEDLRERFPERHLAVIDTRGASLGEGFPALEGAVARDKGASFEEVVQTVEDRKYHMCQYFTVEDLMYLKKGGRLPASAAFIGNLLQIKPMLTANEKGEIIMKYKVRGMRKTLKALAEHYRDEATDKTAPVGIAHADAPESLAYLTEKLREAGCTGEIMPVCYEPVTGSHVGPGAIALFFYGEKRELAE